MGGRPKKPASSRVGNWGNKEEKEKAIQAEQEIKGNDDKIFIVPEKLDEIGKEYYKFLVDELQETGVLSNLDIPLLTQTADCLSKMQQADEILKQSGLMITEMDRYGNEKYREHPMVKTKQNYLSQFRALATQLGMSPSSRAQLAELKLNRQQDAQDPVLQALGIVDK